MTVRPARLVLIQDAQGNTWAVGPVHRDESIDRLRDLAAQAGHEVVGTALHSSAGAFAARVRSEAGR